MVVVDIGGGSSEFCAVAAGGLAQAAGLRLGSDRLTTRFGRHDPPDPDDIAAMATAAATILADALPARPTDLVAVGGTASNLLKVTAGGTTDRRLTRARLAEALATLTSRPALETSQRFGVNPIRARLLPAGAVIVEGLLRRYAVDELRVSEQGLREGAILVAQHAGREWRDRLAELAHGWSR